MIGKIVLGRGVPGVVRSLGAVVVFGGGVAGCLDRHVVAGSPTTKTTFTNTVSQSGIDKVDILFDIDNSASMGDKQQYLVQAIPQMIARLVTPRCLNPDGTPGRAGANADLNGLGCPAGESAEFKPVHDMHIGVVTSSLGPRLGVTGGAPTCNPERTFLLSAGSSENINAHTDDKGHLINRTAPYGSGPPLADASQLSFLNWFPPASAASANAGVDAGVSPIATVGAAGTNETLVGDFTELVGGAGESGCGIESQLESWYRFLVQPDPYDSIGSVPPAASAPPNTPDSAVWVGVDATIIQQRHDFLRPDSLVAVIVLSDENDSEIDVRSYQQTGWQFMSQDWPPPRATAACDPNPDDPGCKPCASLDPTAAAADPSCKLGSYWDPPKVNAPDDWGSNLNLRHVHMRQKYAVDPQFPLTRYYLGLTSTKVPNRDGEYPAGADSYVGNPTCTNPLFAASLPTAADATAANIGTSLCNLPPGTRAAGDIFFAHIGGVPHQLLQWQVGEADDKSVVQCKPPTLQADCPQKDQLAPIDWVKVLGTGPASYVPAVGASGGSTFPAMSYDLTGIDPHMIESSIPRTQLANPPASSPPVSTLSGPSFTTNPSPDPINGREWVTNTGGSTRAQPVDREYACTFQLPTSPVNLQRDCAAQAAGTVAQNSCDCTGTDSPNDAVPPLCAKSSSDGSIQAADYTVQTYAKAYPTIRELMLANMMGDQGVVSSLCPIHTEEQTPGDPLYGYRPAVNAIVNRLQEALGAECVPKLQPNDAGDVPCLILVTFPQGMSPSSSDACASFAPAGAFDAVDPSVLTQYRASQHATWAMEGDAGATDPSTLTTCRVVKQFPTTSGTCLGQSEPGWCYVTNASHCGTDADGLVFSHTFIPNGATISLQCIADNATE